MVAQREYTYDVLRRPTARTTFRQSNVVNDTFALYSYAELAGLGRFGSTPPPLKHELNAFIKGAILAVG